MANHRSPKPGLQVRLLPLLRCLLGRQESKGARRARHSTAAIEAAASGALIPINVVTGLGIDRLLEQVPSGHLRNAGHAGVRLPLLRFLSWRQESKAGRPPRRWSARRHGGHGMSGVVDDGPFRGCLDGSRFRSREEHERRLPMGDRPLLRPRPGTLPKAGSADGSAVSREANGPLLPVSG